MAAVGVEEGVGRRVSDGSVTGAFAAVGEAVREMARGNSWFAVGVEASAAKASAAATSCGESDRV